MASESVVLVRNVDLFVFRVDGTSTLLQHDTHTVDSLSYSTRGVCQGSLWISPCRSLHPNL